MATKDMDKLVNHAKSTGFVYQGSEIYDGLANTWDFGPLGVEMKNNIMFFNIRHCLFIRPTFTMYRRIICFN